MPNGQTDMGPGWTTDEFGNPVYDPSTPIPETWQEQDFTGTVGSLSYYDEFSGTTLEDTWQSYFDEYDPRKEQLLSRQAGTDISQAESIWSLREEQLGKALTLQESQLGEDWRGRKESIGAEAGSAYKQAFGLGRQAGRKSGMSFSGTATEMGRQQTGDISEAYKRSFGLGKTAYDQAMASGKMKYGQAIESGELSLQQDITDIYQGLERGVFGARSAWEEAQENMLEQLLGGDIYQTSNADLTSGNDPSATGPPGWPSLGAYQAWISAGRDPDTASQFGWSDPRGPGAGTPPGQGCFVAGTRIDTKDGIVPIEKIKVGDSVKTYDFDNEKYTYSNITETFKHKDMNGYLVINGFIKTTKYHPFYSNGGWKKAGRLLVGDKILHVDGVEHEVKSIDVINRKLDVYNIEVDHTHNYFAEGYLVHNK